MTTIRKYRKPVDRNGWMAKLQAFTFGRTPNFTGYCPFFWLTWVCLLFLPITAIARLIIAAVQAGISVVGRLPERRPSDDTLIHIWEMAQESSLEEARAACMGYHRFEAALRWIDAHPDWENCVNAALLRRSQKQVRKAVAAAKGEQRARTISKYSGYVVKPLLGVVTLLVTVGVIRLLYAGLRHLTLADLLLVIELTVGVAVVCFVGVSLVAVVIRVRRGWSHCPRDPRKIGIFRRVLHFFGDALYNIGVFLFETIEAIYTRECPLIEWSDESGPITRNN